MKILLLLLLVTSTHFASGQKASFSFYGTLSSKLNSKTLYLSGPSFNDSVKLNGDGTFKYRGSLKIPGLMLFYTENSYAWAVWLNKGVIELNIEEYSPNGNSDDKTSLRTKLLKGPKETIAYETMTELYNQCNSKYKSNSQNRLDSVLNDFFPTVSSFVHNSPNSYLSPFLVRNYNFGLKKSRMLYTLLHDNPNKGELKVLKEQINRMAVSQKGTIVKNFTQPDINGKQFQFYSLKKPFILIHFWASNCGACRVENPSMINFYNKYQPKGLEIVGVSLDDADSSWRKAVKTDSLSWINISDLKGFKNSLAQKYVIDHIPFNILVDSSFSIIYAGEWFWQTASIIDKASEAKSNFVKPAANMNCAKKQIKM